MRSAQRRSRRVPTNLSVAEDLVRRAKALRINLSEVLETALEQAVAAAERDAWLAANRDAIDAYNALVAKRGLFSDGWRRF